MVSELAARNARRWTLQQGEAIPELFNSQSLREVFNKQYCVVISLDAVVSCKRNRLYSLIVLYFKRCKTRFVNSLTQGSKNILPNCLMTRIYLYKNVAFSCYKGRKTIMSYKWENKCFGLRQELPFKEKNIVEVILRLKIFTYGIFFM